VTNKGSFSAVAAQSLLAQEERRVRRRRRRRRRTDSEVWIVHEHELKKREHEEE
jgi:hypothetical protein